MDLAGIQAEFQSALLHGGNSVLDHFGRPARESKDVMFGVYRNAYLFRLADIVAGDFARLRSYTGDEAFYGLARNYIAAHPSRFASARDFSRNFPHFVAAQSIARDAPIVAAIAQLEGLLNDVFDCADTAPLTLGDLATFAPGDFGDLTFKPHPTVSRLDGPAGLEAAFTALSNGEPPPALLAQAREQIIVWRWETTPRYRLLSSEEAMLWDEASKGAEFAALCEMLATYDDPENASLRAAQHLHNWIASGLLSAASKRSKS